MTDQPTNGGPKPQTKTRAEERAESVKTPSRVELSARVEELERELADARARGEEHLYNWQRSAADFANFKRRTDEEPREQRGKRSKPNECARSHVPLPSLFVRRNGNRGAGPLPSRALYPSSNSPPADLRETMYA